MGLAPPPQVRNNHSVVFGKLRRLTMPAEMRLRIAVQHEDGRTISSGQREDLAVSCRHKAPLKAGQQFAISLFKAYH
jgi:hypothetical protein